MNIFIESRKKCKLITEARLLTEGEILQAQQDLDSLLDEVILRFERMPDDTDDLKSLKQKVSTVFKNLEKAAGTISEKSMEEPGMFSRFAGAITGTNAKDKQEDEAATKIKYLATHAKMNLDMFESVITDIAGWMNAVAISDEEINFLQGLPKELSGSDASSEKKDDQSQEESGGNQQKESFNFIHKSSLASLLLEASGITPDVAEKMEKIRLISFATDGPPPPDLNPDGYKPSTILQWVSGWHEGWDDAKKKEVEKLNKKFIQAENEAKRVFGKLGKNIENAAKQAEKELKAIADMKDLLEFEIEQDTTLSPKILLGEDGKSGIFSMGWFDFKEFGMGIKSEVIDKAESTLKDMLTVEVSPEVEKLFDDGEPFMQAMNKHEAFKDIDEMDKAVLSLVMAASEKPVQEIFKESKFFHHAGFKNLLTEAITEISELIKGIDYKFKFDSDKETAAKIWGVLGVEKAEEASDLTSTLEDGAASDLNKAIAGLTNDNSPVTLTNDDNNEEIIIDPNTEPEAKDLSADLAKLDIKTPKDLEDFIKAVLNLGKLEDDDVNDVEVDTPDTLNAEPQDETGDDIRTFSKEDFIKEIPNPTELKPEILAKIYDIFRQGPKGVGQHDENQWEKLKLESIHLNSLNSLLVEEKTKWDDFLPGLIYNAASNDKEAEAQMQKYFKNKEVKKFFKDKFDIEWELGGLPKIQIGATVDAIKKIDKKIDGDAVALFLTGLKELNADLPFIIESKVLLKEFLSDLTDKIKGQDELTTKALDLLDNENFLKYFEDEFGFDIKSAAEAGDSKKPAYIKKAGFPKFHQAFGAAGNPDPELQPAIFKGFLDDYKKAGAAGFRKALNQALEDVLPKPLFQENVYRWQRLAGIIKD